MNSDIIKNHDLQKCNVSVITTVFNYEQYLPRAIDSAIANNFDSLEIVIVNDCSTDNSFSIAESYLNTDNNITVINNLENYGLIRSKNLAIDICVGDYIFILDADNTIYPNCLHEHYNAIKDTDAIAAYGIIDCYNLQNELVEFRSNEPFSYEKLKFGNYIDAMAMFNKQKLLDIGKYDTYLSQYGSCLEDYEVWLRIASMGLNILFIPQHLSRYLIKTNSMSHIMIQYLNDVIPYLKSKYNLYI